MKRPYFNPYQALKAQAQEWFDKYLNRRPTPMCYIPKEKIHVSWSMDDIYHKTEMAKALGYEVRVLATDRGLEFECVKVLPVVPWSLR